jgi:hypothetical protein
MEAIYLLSDAVPAGSVLEACHGLAPPGFALTYCWKNGSPAQIANLKAFKVIADRLLPALRQRGKTASPSRPSGVYSELLLGVTMCRFAMFRLPAHAGQATPST